MPRKFFSHQPTALAELHAFLRTRESDAHAHIGATVRDIIASVKKGGDKALCDATTRFDTWNAAPHLLRVSLEEIAHAVSVVEPETKRSLKVAAERIRAYSEKQLPEDARYTDDLGVTLGWQWKAMESVGLYVPGGKAAYPSSVLMNAIPAIVAGVKRLAMVVPAPEGEVNYAVLAAAEIAGITEIYKIGGAQAVAALAYGTETVAPVDMIVGPGNAYVAEAKRQVFGVVGIDMIAGPSEICVVADDQNPPAWIAADLLSQAEHDEMAQSILITNSEAFADAVQKEIQIQLKNSAREDITRASWENFGAIILVKEWSEALPFINAIAPEHLELAIESPDDWLQHIQHAGAIFLGRHTPEAIGDYVAGPSHVLPTSRAARFSSGISVLTFLKRTSIAGCTPQACKTLSMHGGTLADAEGLPAHARSMRLRNS